MKQAEKIIAKMLSNPDKQWWLPQDFMENDEFFVGYEASARLSELAREHEDAIDSVRQGKYIARRIKFECYHLWIDDLYERFEEIIHKYLPDRVCSVCGAYPHTVHCNNARCDE